MPQLYVAKIQLPHPTFAIELDPDDHAIFLTQFDWIMRATPPGVPLERIERKPGYLLQPPSAGVWYLASYGAAKGRYRLVGGNIPSVWVDFQLSAPGAA